MKPTVTAAIHIVKPRYPSADQSLPISMSTQLHGRTSEIKNIVFGERKGEGITADKKDG